MGSWAARDSEARPANCDRLCLARLSVEPNPRLRKEALVESPHGIRETSGLLEGVNLGQLQGVKIFFVIRGNAEKGAEWRAQSSRGHELQLGPPGRRPY